MPLDSCSAFRCDRCVRSNGPRPGSFRVLHLREAWLRQYLRGPELSRSGYGIWLPHGVRFLRIRCVVPEPAIQAACELQLRKSCHYGLASETRGVVFHESSGECQRLCGCRLQLWNNRFRWQSGLYVQPIRWPLAWRRSPGGTDRRVRISTTDFAPHVRAGGRDPSVLQSTVGTVLANQPELQNGQSLCAGVVHFHGFRLVAEFSRLGLSVAILSIRCRLRRTFMTVGTRLSQRVRG